MLTGRMGGAGAGRAVRSSLCPRSRQHSCWCQHSRRLAHDYVHSRGKFSNVSPPSLSLSLSCALCAGGRPVLV
eukprot:1647737-Rhodomonas_salina.1